MLGVDYSSGRPSPASIKRAGYGFVGRYLAPLDNGRPSWKELDGKERDALHKAGLAIVLFFESTAGRARGGTSAGRADGRTATQRADALRVPAGVAVYFAVDTEISRGALTSVLQYFDGCRETLRSDLVVGGYGQYSVIEAAVSGGHIELGCQTAAWSSGKVSKKAALYQRAQTVKIGGVSCDVDETRAEHFGGWYTDGGDMALTDDDVNRIAAAVAKNWQADTLPAPDGAPSAKTNKTWTRDNALRGALNELYAINARLDTIEKTLAAKK